MRGIDFERMGIQTEGKADVQSWVDGLRRGEAPERNSRRIFERYYGWVRGFFTRRRVSPERAEELAQETFLQAFQRIASFRGDGTFDAWIFAIVANIHRNERRRLSQQKRDAEEIPLAVPMAKTGAPVEVVDGTDSPEEATFNRQRLRALARAIETLPERPRECVRLRLAGYDYPEIAEVLRLSQSTARVHVFTARQRLREELGDVFGSHEKAARTKLQGVP